MQQVISQVKTFHPFTHVGLAAILAFTVLFFTAVTYRWWVMLPLAIGAVVALSRQIKLVSGFERKVCVVGFWVALSLLVSRDIFMSNRICTVLDGFAAMADAFKGM